MEDSVLRIYSV